LKVPTRQSSATAKLIAAASLLICALPLSAQSGKLKSAAKPSKAPPPRSPRSWHRWTAEKISRQDIVDDLFADQMAQLAVTNPQFLNSARARPVAASIGALLMQKMAKSNGKPVTIAREEAIDWLFKDKPPILVNTVEIKIRELVVKHEAKKHGVSYTPEEVAAKTAESMAMARQSLHMASTMSG